MKSLYPVIAAALLAGTASAQPADTLAKIKSSGSIPMGVRDSTAFSFSLGDGKYAGFHYDVCSNVIRDIHKQLGMGSLATRYQLVTSQNRIPLVTNGSVDLECGATTNNAARQKEVAFAVTTYVEEVRMAVRANSGIASIKDLANRSVVTTTGTTSVQLLRRHERANNLDFKPIYGKDHAESFLMLEQGRADAYVIDASTLATFIAKSKNPADLKIVGEVLSVEPIAIMLRKDDPAFKKAVDDSIRAQIKSGEMEQLWDKWFLKPTPPNNVTINLPLGQATRDAWASPNDKPAEDYQKK